MLQLVAVQGHLDQSIRKERLGAAWRGNQEEASAKPSQRVCWDMAGQKDGLCSIRAGYSMPVRGACCESCSMPTDWSELSFLINEIRIMMPILHNCGQDIMWMRSQLIGEYFSDC